MQVKYIKLHKHATYWVSLLSSVIAPARCLIKSRGKRESGIESERERGKMSLPVVNWAYRFLMCQAVALQMRDGTFLRCIFLCFLFKANEVSLPVATWAGRSDTRDSFTSPFTKSSGESSSPTPSPPLPPTLSQPEGKYTHMQQHIEWRTQFWHGHTHCSNYILKNACTYALVRLISWTFVINSHCRPAFAAYSLSRLQTCLFLLSQNSKHPLSKDFFLSLLLVFSFFSLHAFRSPTNELNTEETWKRLDEAWLFEQWGDDIVPYDYKHLYQQKQGRRNKTGEKLCRFPCACTAGWLYMVFASN